MRAEHRGASVVVRLESDRNPRMMLVRDTPPRRAARKARKQLCSFIARSSACRHAMFGLYGDLPAPAKADDAVKPSGWAGTTATSLKPAPRKAVQLVPPPAIRRPAAQPGTVRPQVIGDGGVASQSGGATEPTASVAGASGTLSASVNEEYDPARPNSYEEVLYTSRSALHSTNYPIEFSTAM